MCFNLYAILLATSLNMVGNMTTDEKIQYIRSTYENMLTKNMLTKHDIEWLYVANMRTIALIEAWSIDGTISRAQRVALEKEAYGVCNYCCDKLNSN